MEYQKRIESARTFFRKAKKVLRGICGFGLGGSVFAEGVVGEGDGGEKERKWVREKGEKWRMRSEGRMMK